MLDVIAQVVIAVCGVVTVYLTQDTRPKWRRCACLVGVFARPAWFYVTVSAHQWGVVAVCVIYAVGWGRGVWNFWIRKVPA